MRMRARASWLALCVSVLVPGWSPAEGSAATPEALARELASVKSLRELVAFISPADRPSYGARLIMAARLARLGAMGDAERTRILEEGLAAAQQQHGVRTDVPVGEGETYEQTRARHHAMFEGVDVAAFAESVEALLGADAADDEVVGIPRGELESVRVMGDFAGVSIGGRPMRFALVEGRWFITE